MRKLMKYTLFFVFVIAVLTGLNNLFGGAVSIPGVTDVVSAPVDSELRCLSVFWIAFGVFCFWVARNIKARRNFVIPIALVLFLSALARALSLFLVGNPGNILLLAMLIEYILAFIIYFTNEKTKNKK